MSNQPAVMNVLVAREIQRQRLRRDVLTLRPSSLCWSFHTSILKWRLLLEKPMVRFLLLEGRFRNLHQLDVVTLNIKRLIHTFGDLRMLVGYASNRKILALSPTIVSSQLEQIDVDDQHGRSAPCSLLPLKIRVRHINSRCRASTTYYSMNEALPV